MATLPQEIQSAVPSCAASCLSKYVTEYYGSCTDDDFSCLCTQYSSDGHTLGEFAYICFQLDCPQSPQSKAASLYNICSAQSGAVSPTHSTLTVPATSVTSGLSSSTPSPTESPSITSSSIVTSTTSTTSATATLAAATTPSTSSHVSTLTSAQAVGVSIGAFSALIITICIIYCIACMRGRRQRKQKLDEKNYDFVDQLPPDFVPYEPRSTRPYAQRPSEQRSLPIYDSYKSGRTGYGHNSDAVRTLSQLLPELPAPRRPQPPPRHPGRVKSPPQTPATLFEEDRSSPVQSSFPLPDHPLPTPLQIAHKTPSNTVREPVYASTYTSPSEGVSQPSLSIKIPRQAPRSKIPSPVPFPPPPIPHEHSMTVADQRLSGKSQGSGASLLNYYASPEADGRSPELDKITPIDDSTQKRRPVPKAILVTRPTHPPRAVRNSGGSDTSFESNDLDEPTPPEEESKNLSPVAEHSPIAAIRYPKVPRSSNQAVPRSPPSKPSPSGLQGLCAEVTKDRNGPPNYSRSLKAHYGPVVARNYKTPDRKISEQTSLSGSTLAAKRSKSSADMELERKLRIDTSHSRAYGLTGTKTDTRKMSPAAVQRADFHESPLKGYGRVTNSGGRGTMQRKAVPQPISMDLLSPVKQEVIVRSPLWEPKLTPSRRGDDLYLSVGMASP